MPGGFPVKDEDLQFLSDCYKKKLMSSLLLYTIDLLLKQ
jgi:hypothetical protein